MKRKTQLISILTSMAVACLFTFAHVAQAETHSENKVKLTKEEKAAKKAEKFNREAELLGLNESQKLQLQSLKKARKVQTDPMKKQRKALKKELKKLDENSAEYASKKSLRKDLKKQMNVHKDQERQEVAKVLTAEQLAQWDALKAEKDKKGKKK